MSLSQWCPGVLAGKLVPGSNFLTPTQANLIIMHRRNKGWNREERSRAGFYYLLYQTSNVSFCYSFLENNYWYSIMGRRLCLHYCYLSEHWAIMLDWDKFDFTRLETREQSPPFPGASRQARTDQRCRQYHEVRRWWMMMRVIIALPPRLHH